MFKPGIIPCGFGMENVGMLLFCSLCSLPGVDTIMSGSYTASFLLSLQWCKSSDIARVYIR